MYLAAPGFAVKVGQVGRLCDTDLCRLGAGIGPRFMCFRVLAQREIDNFNNAIGSSRRLRLAGYIGAIAGGEKRGAWWRGRIGRKRINPSKGLHLGGKREGQCGKGKQYVA